MAIDPDEASDANVLCALLSRQIADCGRFADGSVRILRSATGRVAYTLIEETGSGFGVRLPVTCLRWRPDLSGTGASRVLLTADASGSVCHWQADASSERTHTFSKKSATRCMPWTSPPTRPRSPPQARTRRFTSMMRNLANSSLHSVPMTSATPAMRLPAIHHAYFRSSSCRTNHTSYSPRAGTTRSCSGMCVNVLPPSLYGPRVWRLDRREGR